MPDAGADAAEVEVPPCEFVECGFDEVCVDGKCVCLEPCGDKVCGKDLCGDPCGTCEQGFACSPEGQCYDEDPMCPPVPPFGTTISSTVPNAVLFDCDDNIYEMHDLCPQKISWVYLFNGW